MYTLVHVINRIFLPFSFRIWWGNVKQYTHLTCHVSLRDTHIYIRSREGICHFMKSCLIPFITNLAIKLIHIRVHQHIQAQSPTYNFNLMIYLITAYTNGSQENINYYSINFINKSLEVQQISNILIFIFQEQFRLKLFMNLRKLIHLISRFPSSSIFLTWPKALLNLFALFMFKARAL